MDANCARPMTPEEEIDTFDIPEETKDWMERKLGELIYNNTALQAENDRQREQIISLKNACFSLAAALKQQYDSFGKQTLSLKIIKFCIMIIPISCYIQ